jgi:uncharacterized membrane protein YcaP (DUF421 family)
MVVLNFLSAIHSGIEWKDLFGTDKEDLNALQMMVRTLVTFLLALVLIRVAGIRSFGSKSAFDIVLSITVGAVLSRCITGHYSYLACVSAALVLALLHRIFAMLALYNNSLGKIIKGKADIVFSSGQIHWDKMKQHNLSFEDLEQAARKSGLKSIAQVDTAFFETDGKVSIIPKTGIIRNINEAG